MTHRDLGYARISKDDERRGKGVGRQVEDVRRHSEATGGQLVAMFTENDVSASKYARRKRKEYPRLLEAARAGIGDRIIIYRMDRLLRIPDELEALIKLCEDRNVPVVNLNGTMDLTTAEGRKHARDRVSDAAFESDLISERTRRSFDESAAEGRPHAATGKSRPFGFNEDGITHRPPEADAIAKAATDVLYADTALNEIARRWNAAGFTTRLGRPWENRSVVAVLTGYRAAGLRVHRRGQPDEKVYPAVWNPIIDEATHRALRRKLIERPTRRPGRRTEYTGLFIAGDRPLRLDRHRGIYRTYRRFPGEEFVNIQISPAAELEELVREWLFARVESGDLARAVAARRAVAAEQRPTESAMQVQALIDQADEDEATGVMDRRGWLNKRKILVARLRRAEAAEASSLKVADTVPLDIRARWAGWDVDRRGAVLREVFDRIEVAPATRKGPGFDRDRVTPILR